MIGLPEEIPAEVLEEFTRRYGLTAATLISLCRRPGAVDSASGRFLARMQTAWLSYLSDEQDLGTDPNVTIVATALGMSTLVAGWFKNNHTERTMPSKIMAMGEAFAKNLAYHADVDLDMVEPPENDGKLNG